MVSDLFTGYASGGVGTRCMGHYLAWTTPWGLATATLAFDPDVGAGDSIEDDAAFQTSWDPAIIRLKATSVVW